MADCEMCGKVGPTVRAKIENSIMNVCASCAKYGERLGSPRQASENLAFAQRRQVRRQRADPRENLRVRDEYASIVKSAREARKLKMEDAAKRLNEKESLIHKVESGNMRPSFRLAEKLEKFYHVRLFEEIAAGTPGDETREEIPVSSGPAEPLTMGDLLKDAMKRR